jgi:hypothetical protein
VTAPIFHPPRGRFRDELATGQDVGHLGSISIMLFLLA